MKFEQAQFSNNGAIQLYIAREGSGSGIQIQWKTFGSGFRSGSGSCKKVRIRPDPDPQHWLILGRILSFLNWYGTTYRVRVTYPYPYSGLKKVFSYRSRQPGWVAVSFRTVAAKFATYQKCVACPALSAHLRGAVPCRALPALRGHLSSARASRRTAA